VGKLRGKSTPRISDSEATQQNSAKDWEQADLAWEFAQAVAPLLVRRLVGAAAVPFATKLGFDVERAGAVDQPTGVRARRICWSWSDEPSPVDLLAFAAAAETAVEAQIGPPRRYL
jgi:hypothetical protein